jgi:prevent-host-death family protein
MKTITMMQLRSGPGELFREVWKHGRSILITKGGKPAAKLVPADETIVIERDGTFRNGTPLTFRQPITSDY